jgi:hypothetical protein
MTLDEAVATFKRELPGWWWKVMECWQSCEAECGPDTRGPESDRSMRDFPFVFTVELPQPQPAPRHCLRSWERPNVGRPERSANPSTRAVQQVGTDREQLFRDD